MNARSPEVRRGTQSIERAVGVLRVIASRGRRGIRIAEIVGMTGLTHSTCFRMLQRLHEEGLIDKDDHTRKFFLGPLIHELGLLARPRYQLSEICDNALRGLAETTQDTVYLSERSGLEAVCTARHMGDYPIKVLPLDVGIRRPLGVGAGGLAILGAMDLEEAEAVIEINGPRYAGYRGLTLSQLRRALVQTRAQGYSFLDNVATPGSAALGVVLTPNHPVAAISVAAISGRMQSSRHEALARTIREQVEQLADVLNGLREIQPT